MHAATQVLSLLARARPQFPRRLLLELPYMDAGVEDQLLEAVEGYGPSNVVIDSFMWEAMF
jgi:hypothetical protein